MRVLIACGGTIFKRALERRVRKDCLSQLANLMNTTVDELDVETVHDDATREPTYVMKIHSLPESFAESRTHSYDAILLEGCQVSGTWQEREDGHILLSQHIDKVGRNREILLGQKDGWNLAEKLIPSKWFHQPSRYGFVRTRIPLCPSRDNFLTDTVIARLCSLLRERGLLVFFSPLVHDPEIGKEDLDGPVIKCKSPGGHWDYDLLKNAIAGQIDGNRPVTCLSQISPWVFQKA